MYDEDDLLDFGQKCVRLDRDRTEVLSVEEIVQEALMNYKANHKRTDTTKNKEKIENLSEDIADTIEELGACAGILEADNPSLCEGVTKHNNLLTGTERLRYQQKLGKSYNKLMELFDKLQEK